MPYTPFTLSELRLIFQLSETGGGHAGQCHVGIDNDSLWGRVQDYQGSGIAARTAFLSFNDQLQAALEVLNAPANSAALEDFRVNKRPGRPYCEISHGLAAPMRMRYGMGGGAKTFPCRLVTVVLDKNLARPRQMHVVTCFGEMG